MFPPLLVLYHPRHQGPVPKQESSLHCRGGTIISCPGVKEINLIAQDTTFYGRDLRTTSDLATLVRRLCRIEGLRWIRLLYCHPDHFSKNLIARYGMRRRSAATSTFPFSTSVTHAAEDGQEKKKRGHQKTHPRAESVHSLPRLRTTVMVGFPGETEADFSRLLDFIKETAFEHLGAFRYSDEEGTRAVRMEEKYARCCQRALPPNHVRPIAHFAEKNRSLIGSRQTVMVEGTDRKLGRLPDGPSSRPRRLTE